MLCTPCHGPENTSIAQKSAIIIPSWFSDFMRRPFPSWCRSYTFVFCWIAGLCLPALAQTTPKSDPRLFDQVPFDQWLKEGPTEQIPFKFHVYDARLSIYQRLVVHIELLVHGKELSKRGD